MGKFVLEIDEDDLPKQISQLPAINARVLGLYFLEKKTVRAIALELRLSVSVIRHHLAKGMYLIKKQTGCYENPFRMLYGGNKTTS